MAGHAFSNGWGTKILSTTLGLLLAGAIATGFAMYSKINVVISKLDNVQSRIDRIDNRVNRLERRRWQENRNGNN